MLNLFHYFIEMEQYPHLSLEEKALEAKENQVKRRVDLKKKTVLGKILKKIRYNIKNTDN